MKLNETDKKKLSKIIKIDGHRQRKNTFEYASMSLIGTDLVEINTGASVFLSRQDIAEACADYVEKHIMK